MIRNPEKLGALPLSVVARAAGLAAWYSKARCRRQVDVHLCQVADVRKRRGAPPGEVELQGWQRLRVRPVRLDDTAEA